MEPFLSYPRVKERGEKEKPIEWELGFVIKEGEKKLFCSLSLLFLELLHNGSTYLTHFSPTKKRITFVLKPNMNVFSVCDTSEHKGILRADLFVTIKLALPDTNQITHHNDK